MPGPNPAADADWETIESLYRAGQVSSREIARNYGVSEALIRKRAKKLGWQRDLRGAVEQRAGTKLVHAEAATVFGADSLKPLTDSEVVEAAAESRAQLIQGHRRDAKQARTLVQSLFGELGALTAEAQEEARILAAKDPEALVKLRVNRVASLLNRAQVAQRLAAAMQTMVTIEREALLGLAAAKEDEEKPASPFRMFFGGKAQKDAVDAGKAMPAPTEAGRTTH